MPVSLTARRVFPAQSFEDGESVSSVVDGGFGVLGKTSFTSGGHFVLHTFKKAKIKELKEQQQWQLNRRKGRNVVQSRVDQEFPQISESNANPQIKPLTNKWVIIKRN